MNATSDTVASPGGNRPQIVIDDDSRHTRWRMLKDRIAGHVITVGGLSAIFAITLIFVYLLYVVIPLFLPAKVKLAQEFEFPSDEAVVFMAMEETQTLALRVLDDGVLRFFDPKTGQNTEDRNLALPPGSTLTLVQEIWGHNGLAVAANDQGQGLWFRHRYQVGFDANDERYISPIVEFPFGSDWFELDQRGTAVTALDARLEEEKAVIVALTEDRRVLMQNFEASLNMLDDSMMLESEGIEEIRLRVEPQFIALDPLMEWLFIADSSGELQLNPIKRELEPVQSLRLLDNGARLQQMQLLLGGVSLLVADDLGHITQWMLVRDANNRYGLQRVREFASDGAVVQLITEPNRKGFLALHGGNLAIYYSTSERKLLEKNLTEGAFDQVYLSPRSNVLMGLIDNHLQLWDIQNEHPEISFQALWGKVWYEGYSEPKHLWQSSAATNDFEPKFSLTPLLVGTLKAAFYAMLVAVPLALMGAIYTAYFMAPKMRQMVKPSIEIMEAMPTVILGFLAGLWLAPFVESNLPGIFALLLLMPLGMLTFAFIWNLFSRQLGYNVGDGWQSLILIPVVLLVGYISIAISPWLEDVLFGGDMRIYVAEAWGLTFDQRNALVVGLAMGFAVIPTIFSIAEDAIFSVPKHLTQGSLALGSTYWQTLVRVILPTASPAMFSAVMLGLGRAVGETMIVLMATGNTPVMDMNIFEGMRTLSANIAVEMPESEVDSSHYRVLFLAALVLFVITFMFNTVAELIRQRLRKKYSNL